MDNTRLLHTVLRGYITYSYFLAQLGLDRVLRACVPPELRPIPH